MGKKPTRINEGKTRPPAIMPTQKAGKTKPPPPPIKLKFQANFAASSFCFPCYGWVYEQNHGYILFINVVTKNTLVYRI